MFLNSIVGGLAEPAVREGLARFVKEGADLAASTARRGRRAQLGRVRGDDRRTERAAPDRAGGDEVYDPSSALTKPFAGKELPFREEYYRFEHEGRGRLRWDSVRVLLTVALDDPKIEPRPWNGYKRPDNIYPVAWIRTYGKGRVFYNSLGHMPETFMTPEIVGHFLAGAVSARRPRRRRDPESGGPPVGTVGMQRLTGWTSV